jgi:hypothetical protein
MQEWLKGARLRSLVIVLFVATALTLAMALAACGSNGPVASDTAYNFCSYINKRYYESAYNQLSANFRQHDTEANFAAQLKDTTCKVDKVQQSGQTATATITFTGTGPMAAGKSLTQQAYLIEKNNVWLIDRFSRQ